MREWKHALADALVDILQDINSQVPCKYEHYPGRPHRPPKKVNKEKSVNFVLAVFDETYLDGNKLDEIIDALLSQLKQLTDNTSGKYRNLNVQVWGTMLDLDVDRPDIKEVGSRKDPGIQWIEYSEEIENKLSNDKNLDPTEKMEMIEQIVEYNSGPSGESNWWQDSYEVLVGAVGDESQVPTTPSDYNNFTRLSLWFNIGEEPKETDDQSLTVKI